MMDKPELVVGDTAPSFCLPDQNGKDVCLEEYRGKWVVLYFYPKDNTKGCTLEALGFTMNREEFETLGAVILGISPDSVKSHQSFCDKHGLTITLLSDPEHEILEKYNVWQLKKMYGREFYGVVRSTFLVDGDGRVAHIWKNVRVKGHVDAVKVKLVDLS
jgi:peroxiredoxin Q/BCP